MKFSSNTSLNYRKNLFIYESCLFWIFQFISFLTWPRDKECTILFIAVFIGETSPNFYFSNTNNEINSYLDIRREIWTKNGLMFFCRALRIRIWIKFNKNTWSLKKIPQIKHCHFMRECSTMNVDYYWWNKIFKISSNLTHNFDNFGWTPVRFA